jgi:hypothetical protein
MSTLQTYNPPPQTVEVDDDDKARFEKDAEIGAAGESKVVIEEVLET